MRQIADPVDPEVDCDTQTACLIASSPATWIYSLEERLSDSDPTEIILNYESFDVTRRDMSTVLPS